MVNPLESMGGKRVNYLSFSKRKRRAGFSVYKYQS